MFKVGDKIIVHCSEDDYCIKTWRGKDIEAEITDISGDVIHFRGDDGTLCSHELDAKRSGTRKLIINPINKSMNLKENFTLIFTPEPQKSFRKAGITNGDNLLTDDGQKIFLSWLLTKNQDAFKAEVVDGLLAEEEKNK